MRICPNEIRDLASRIQSDKTKKIDPDMERFIMRKRIKTIDKEISQALETWRSHTKDLNNDLEIPQEIKDVHFNIKNYNLDKFEKN